jgi:hypothetical protein
MGIAFSFFLFMLLIRPQNGSGWSAIGVFDFERKANQFVYSWCYIGQVETFDEPDACLKQCMVGLDAIFGETTN